MLPAFASTDDLAARHPGGVSGDADTARAQAALDDASTLVRAVAGKTWVDDNNELEDVPDVVFTVTVRAALRAFVNPSGVQQQSTGPFSESYANSSSDVYLTNKEQDMIRSAAAGGSGGIYGIDTAPLVGAIHSELCSLNFGANYCSCGASLAGYPLYQNDPDGLTLI